MKIYKFNEYVTEKINQKLYFLRWSSDPDADIKRNFSGHLQAWFDSEDEAMEDYNERINNGDYIPYPPRKDISTGMWNSEPEWGLSGYSFDDEKSFNKAMKEINDISWYHKDDMSQDLFVFTSNNYKLGDGFDGEDVFKDVIKYWYIDNDMTYDDVISIFNK